MRGFVVRILVFFAIVAVLDAAFGAACRYLNSHARGGDTANHYFIAEQMADSVLILGSSRAIHHYDPAVMEDSLHTSVYNCGVDGNGILYQFGRLMTVLERHTPRMVIYDVMTDFDMADDDNLKYTKWLRRWYDKPGMDTLFRDISVLEPLKMHSQFYRYNSSFVQMLSDNFAPRQDISYKGYKPLKGVIDYTPAPVSEAPVEWQPLKYKYFERMIELCRERGIELVVVYSPWLGARSSGRFARMTELCRARGVRVVDMFAEPEISRDPSMFEDASHLNERGAAEFTRRFVSALN